MDSQVVENEAQEESSLKEKTAKGLFWGGISNFVQQVIGMAFGIVIARILSPDDYGLVAMLAIFTAIANTVMDSGFTTALINKKTVKHRDYNAVFWFNVFAAVGMYVILFFAAPLIAHFYKQPILTNLSRILFLSFIIAAVGIAHNAYLLKKIMAKQRGIIDMAAVFCSGTVGLILALNGFAFWGLVAQQLTQISAAVLLRWYYSPWRPTLEFDFTPLKEMFGFGVKIFIGVIVGMLSANIFSVILGRFYGKTETGYYSQGNKWASLGNSVLSGMITGVAQSVLVEASDNIHRQANVFHKLVRFGAFVTFPAMFGLLFVGKEFILLTMGEKWLGSVVFLQLFCVLGSFNFLESIYVYLLISKGKSDVYVWVITAMCFLQISSALLMRPLGIVPMIVAYIVIRLMCFFPNHYFTNKLIGVRFLSIIKDVLPYFAVVTFSIGTTWLITKNIENVYILFSVKIALVALFYIGMLWMTNSVILKESLSFFIRKVESLQCKQH